MSGTESRHDLAAQDPPRGADELSFWRGQFRPRAHEIFRHPAVLISVVVGCLASIFAESLPISAVAISDLASTGLTFASIALGACLSITILSVALPGEGRVARWSRRRNKRGQSILGNLVFVLIWAAMCQVGLIVTCLIALLVGGDLPVFPSGAGSLQRVLVFGSFTVLVYALSELVISILTVSQMVAVVVREEQAR